MDLQDFCARVYDLTAVEKPIAATDALADKVDRHLCRGQFAEVDALLEVLELERVPRSAVTGLLSILSHVPSGKLQALLPFLQRVWNWVAHQDVTAQHRVRHLLARFDGCTWEDCWYQLVEERRHDEAGDLLFEQIEDLLLAGKFAEVDAFLKDVHFYRLDTYAIVSVLTITSAARDKLAEWDAFGEHARERLVELDPDRVDVLLESFVLFSTT